MCEGGKWHDLIYVFKDTPNVSVENGRQVRGETDWLVRRLLQKAP